ncbi:phosphoethanolamine transferase [Microbulbifer sp. SAOS-129_SWC]|uniref:phosphoethanolamine transferase n=1 Tax=Microbulbifer sp. SAOS-129_SWC TaxID=3145235 RepID=UPI0032164443
MRFFLLGLNRRLQVLLGLLFFVALLLPNIAYFLKLHVHLVNFFEEPVFFIWDCLDVVMLAHPFLPVVVFELILLALVGRFGFWMLLHLPFFCWLPLELIYIHRYGVPSSAHILAIITETNYGEALGYIGGWGNLFWLLGYLVVLMIVLVMLLRSGVGWKHRSRWWLLSISAGVLVVSTVSNQSVQASSVDKADSPNERKDIFVAKQFGYGLDEYVKSYPFGLVLRFVQYFQELNILENSARQVASLNSGLNRDAMAENETYVVVIGESSRADRWSINGYTRDTNPLLAKQANLFTFTNAISVSAATRTAVPAILSKTSVDDLSVSRLKRSWITDFKRAGFKVYWLSTQMPVGTHDTMVGVYASLADRTLYLNEGAYQIRGVYDSVVLGELKKIVKESKPKKKLIIIHTLGSHFPYHYRYPEDFSYFKPVPPRNETGNLFDKSQKEVLQNAYDNSVRYTDFVLSSVIDALKLEGERKSSVSAMWYLSDHGQTLFDLGCAVSGHGFDSAYNFHIPVVFWVSDSFLSRRPHVKEAVSENREKPLYAGDFFETILDTGGFERAKPFNSFIEDAYHASSRTVTAQGYVKYDYDKEFAAESCEKI